MRRKEKKKKRKICDAAVFIPSAKSALTHHPALNLTEMSILRNEALGKLSAGIVAADMFFYNSGADDLVPALLVIANYLVRQNGGRYLH